MRSFKTLVIAAAIAGMGASAHAELQNVEVGGSIRIRANYYSFDNAYQGRVAGYDGIRFSPFMTNDERDDAGNIEQRTTLSVKADFTDQVSLYTEVDAHNSWGDNFRSDYFNGLDFDNGTGVNLYQAYIQADEMWGTPLRLRVGRQELSFGSEWLVGVNNASSGFAGLSFDALRLDYITDEFNVAAFLSMIANNAGTNSYDLDRSYDWGKNLPFFGRALTDFNDRNVAEGFLSNDTVFAGVYGSYTGLEDIVIDAYYFGLWDQNNGNVINGFNALPAQFGYPGLANPLGAIFGAPGTLFEVVNPGFLRNSPVGGLTPYNFADATTIHTIGLRGAGTWNALDFEAEVAYQFGEIDLVNRRTVLSTWTGILRPGVWFSNAFAGPSFFNNDLDSTIDYQSFAANAALGYTFDSAWTPRVGLAAAYFGGADSSNHDTRGLFGSGLLNRLYNFDSVDEMSFNRLFSNYEYSEFLENTDLSNALVLSANLGVAPTESVALSAYVTYFMSNEEPNYGWWWNTWNDTDAELGWEVGLSAEYSYSEDLVFRAGWAMFLAGEGINYKSDRKWPFLWRNPLLDRPGNLSANNGTTALGFGDDGDTYHYVYAETELSF
ncbi:MAG: hypothetical protein GC168_09230 [Candidatus Hydrogenedens sp.]|nr:hypothetical protein [Candidatus Hydrogenedens sp.]